MIYQTIDHYDQYFTNISTIFFKQNGELASLINRKIFFLY